MLKSDNANGLFFMRQPCQPSNPDSETASIMCMIERDRGDEGQVIVTWAVYQKTALQMVLATEDFVEYTGQVVFEAGDRSKVILTETLKLPKAFEEVLQHIFTKETRFFFF